MLGKNNRYLWISCQIRSSNDSDEIALIDRTHASVKKTYHNISDGIQQSGIYWLTMHICHKNKKRRGKVQFPPTA